MTVAIIDYGSGNLRSAEKAFSRAADAIGAGDVFVTADPDALKKADRIVLPGVGAFADCHQGLLAVDGMKDALEERVLKDGQPFFGICVGMQLMATTGREHGDHPGLGWIDGAVVPLSPADKALKIPHMGWNVLELHAPDHPVLHNLDHGEHVYFVHSYHFKPANDAHWLAEVGYGESVVAAIGRDNLFGSQFHPEKSQGVGQKIITNFLEWKP